ncbi:MAG: winged helix-turn-helix domain-containing protein [Nitrososphaera sp.]
MTYVVVIGLKERRDTLNIISLILEASSTNACDTKKTTVIMYNTLLNHPRLKEYWKDLTKEGLLVYNKTTKTFKTTDKGLRFLEVFSELDRNQEMNDRIRRRRNNYDTPQNHSERA